VESFVVELEESAKTGILVACNDILIGVLGVADSLKREAFVVIEGLQKMGITPVMVTGDNWRTARAVAKEVCICFGWKSWYCDNFEWGSKAVLLNLCI
jgi:Cu+-exporting ATPase